MAKVKPVLVAPRSQVREVDDKEAARLLQTGSWCAVRGTKPITPGAGWQRNYRQRLRDSGQRMLLIWLPENAWSDLMALKRERETNTELLVRLVEMLRIIL